MLTRRARQPSLPDAVGDAAPACAVPVLSPTELSARIDWTVRRIVRHAAEKAGAPECLTVEHLFLSLLALDCGFIFRKFRTARVRTHDLIRELHDVAAHGSQGDPGGVLAVLHLAGRLASAGTTINTQHLFVAITLEGKNRVAQYLHETGINVAGFLLSSFPYIENTRDVLNVAVGARSQDARQWPDSVVVAVLSRMLEEFARPQPPPPTPQPLPPPALGFVDLRQIDDGPPARNDSEARARHWLQKLVPDQAPVYAASGLIEIESRLSPGRRYRIYRSGRTTEIFERGKLAARSCVQFRTSSFPETDRVIAEYFLIRGDEESYLATANITRP